MSILVGSPDWYAWLDSASSFAFTSAHGTFTAHKEHRKGSSYWKAYRRRAGRLHRVYIGKSATLTLERLNAIAADLAQSISSPGSAAHAGDAAAEAWPNAALPDAASAPADSADVVPPDNAQSLHLLTTKLMIPEPRPHLVPRQRLAELLDVAISKNQKLILISAPAGFGKTTLLVEWLKRIADSGALWALQIADLDQPNLQSAICNLQSPQVAWLALDDDDNHLGHFLAYLIAALETVRPGIGADAWALLRSQVVYPPSHAILTMLVNALADSPTPLILALDDYHTITLQAIHEALAFLLDRMPRHMHIIMTTRADPPLALARLRARGQLIEVRAADLRFTPAEARYLFDQIHALQLPADAVTTLAARTEGWAAGLQLAALSLQQQLTTQIPTFIADFNGSHHYVFDYLMDEVFQQQPAPVRSFLIQTGILSRLCESLCDAVTGQSNARAMLEHLEQANLFLTQLDNNRHWYRYHHLFRDFLGERLDREVGPVDRALLYRRASAWFVQHDLIGEAIDYTLRAQAWADALHCIAPLMANEQMYTYYLDWPRWLAALPDAVLQTEPTLCIRWGWVLIMTGHAEVAPHPLTLAEQVWQAAGDQARLGEALSAHAVALYYGGDLTRALLIAQQALATLPADQLKQRGIATFIAGLGQTALGHVGIAMNLLIDAHAAIKHTPEIFFELVMAFGVARAYHLQGQLQHAATLYQDIIRRAGDTVHWQQPSVHIYLGQLLYEQNDLAAAERSQRMGVTAGEKTGRGRYWPIAYSALAHVRWALGDAAQASLLIEQALAMARLLDIPREIAEAQAQQAWLWLAQGDLPAALHWVSVRALNLNDPVHYERQAEYLMLARIRIAQAHQSPGHADLEALIRLLDRLCQTAQDDRRVPHQIEILALMALAHAAHGGGKQALVPLAAALALAEPEGYIRTFVDEGAPMRSLLIAQRALLLADGSGRQQLSYIERLLDAFPLTAPTAPVDPAGATGASMLLSAREHDVLQLLADGCSVQEIATRLIISAHTARTHVKNIYAKLDAHNRIQALDRARALGVTR